MIIDLFPLHSAVFPHQKVFLQIFEPRYLQLIQRCHRESSIFGICLIEQGHEVGAPAIPVKIGTSVRIKELNKQRENLFFTIVQGERRFRILRLVQEQPLIRVEIEWIDEEIPQFPGDYQSLREKVQKLLDISQKSLETVTEIPKDTSEFVGLLGNILNNFSLGKQAILELPADLVMQALNELFSAIVDAHE